MDFTMETIKNEGGTVGSLAFADLDGDGWLEFLVPNYDNNYIEIYQFFDADADADAEDSDYDNEDNDEDGNEIYDDEEDNDSDEYVFEFKFEQEDPIFSA